MAKNGLLRGPSHKNGGIKAKVISTQQILELQGGESVINAEATKKHWKELSKINQSAGGGVPIEKPIGAIGKKGGAIKDFNQLEKEGKAHRFIKKDGDEDFVELPNAPIISTSKTTLTKDFRNQAKDVLVSNLLNKYVLNIHTNHKIFFTGKSIKKLLNESGDEKLRALFHLKEIVQNATPTTVEEIIRTENDIKLKADSDFLYNFETMIKIDDKWYEYSFKTFVKLNKEKNKIEEIYIYSGHLPKENPI